MARLLVASRRLALALVLTGAPGAVAVRAPAPGTVLPDFDARTDEGTTAAAAIAAWRGVAPPPLTAGPRAEPGPARLAALAALEAEAGVRVVARWDEVTASPRLVFARAGFLGKPDGRAPLEVARDFLLRHGELWRLAPAAAARLPVAATVPLSSGGAVVHFAQEIDGLPVLHGHLSVGVAADGRVIAASGGSVTGEGRLAAATPGQQPAEALVALARLAGVELAGKPEPSGRRGDGAIFTDVPGLRKGTVEVRPIVAPTAHGPRLAWEAVLGPAGSPALYEVAVDDRTLQPLRRGGRTWHADTRGTVFEVDPGAGPAVVVRFPDTTEYRSDESRLGWAAADLTTGNNAVAREDLAGDDEGTLGRQAQAAPAPPWIAFDFPYLDGDPAGSLDATITNLFYGLNRTHDHYRPLGFDERSGNFQVDNLGLGGLGDDPVLGDAQDGSGTNNANFQTAPEGFASRMQMFVWDLSGSLRPSSFDMGVVVHEYGHGISTRLVGGPDSVGCLFGPQGGSMGEGWSDVLAASMLEDPIIGRWVSGDPDGIRRYSLADNPPAGKDYRDFCTYPNDFAPTLCEPHDNGEMWAGFLWLVREAFVATEGAAGVEMFERLVLDALKLTPCSPSMLDARDAVILADRAGSGGAHECLIKEAARDRWMGFSAFSDGGADTEPAAADDPWPECGTDGLVRFTREGLEAGAATASYSCEDAVTVAVVDGNAVAPVRVAVTVSNGDVETLDVAPTVDPAAWQGTLPTRLEALPVPGDGVLQVSGGETVTAEYADPDLAAPATSRAVVDCSPRLALVRHFVRSTTCDDDAVAGYPELPGFLDAGESADLEIHVANLMPVAVTGTLRIATDRPDLLTVLPSTPIPVGFDAALGTATPVAVVTVRVVGADTITAADSANVEIRLQAPGFAAAAPLVLSLALHQDYAVETGLTVTHDVEGEIGGPVGPDWSTGTTQGPGNEWTLVTCANTTPAGRQAYRNGPATCTGNYTDSQGAPFLAAPPLDLGGGDAEAARVTRVAWSHDIDLGSVGNPLFGIPQLFDAEVVGVVFSNDPGAEDTRDPLSLADRAVSFYAQLPDFGIASNTTGWEPESVDVLPNQLSGVDLLQPAYLAWYFLTDVTPSTIGGFPLDDQGRGYYLDDVTITHDVVRRVAAVEPPACRAAVTPFAFPVVIEPAAGAACAGSVVIVDASASEAALCGPPADLEVRFLVEGVPVACFDDPAGTVPRVQDADGWGLVPACHDFPASDTTYQVEVRCAVDPTPTDLREVAVRVLDGLAVVEATPAGFCAGSGAGVALDGSASTMVGCPGTVQYRYVDPATGTPLDCDGDGAPDDFSSDPTCDLAPSDVDVDVLLELQCSALPGCTIAAALAVPATRIDPVLAEVAAAPHCPTDVVAVDAGGTAVVACGGAVEYRFTTSLGHDSGWVADALHDLPAAAADFEARLEARCTTDPGCVFEAAPVAVDVRSGEAELLAPSGAGACPGDPLLLESGAATTVECTGGALEYRFLADGAPLDCDGDGAPDGWTTSGTCDAVHVAGGADFVVEARCPDDPACVFASVALSIAPDGGPPAGSPLGTLQVARTAGCPAGPADVLLGWPDSGLAPPAFVVLRGDDPRLDPVADRLADADGLTAVDAGAACDGGGVPYRGVAIWFYSVLARDTCTGEALP